MAQGVLGEARPIQSAKVWEAVKTRHCTLYLGVFMCIACTILFSMMHEHWSAIWSVVVWTEAKETEMKEFELCQWNGIQYVWMVEKKHRVARMHCCHVNVMPERANDAGGWLWWWGMHAVRSMQSMQVCAAPKMVNVHYVSSQFWQFSLRLDKWHLLGRHHDIMLCAIQSINCSTICRISMHSNKCALFSEKVCKHPRRL